MTIRLTRNSAIVMTSAPIMFPKAACFVAMATFRTVNEMKKQREMMSRRPWKQTYLRY